MKRVFGAVSTALLFAACKRTPPPPAVETPVETPVDRWSEQGMLAEANRFVDDAAFRRSELEASLVNPANTYSRQRLTSYGLRTRGWDLLPEWNPRSLMVDGRQAEPTVPLWDGRRPTTLAEWTSLGREVFFRYPLRAEPIVAWAVRHPEPARQAGVLATKDGTIPGVVSFVDVDGATRTGITCALCHTNVAGGEMIIGEARRSFDYGALRLAYHADTKTGIETTFAHRLRSWGPGRADVTEDDDEDPVAIPDLWGLRHQTFLTQAGTIKHAGLSALAIRQETQLLTSNHQRIRPPVVLAVALAIFLYSLTPPPSPAVAGDVAGGKSLFGKRCANCHSNAGFGGDAIAAARVETDGALANGGARGTGKYRPPALLRVASAAPYFHDGSVAKLDDVFDPARLLPTFTGGALGAGPVKGHIFGMDLPASDRAALVAYLRTL